MTKTLDFAALQDRFLALTKETALLNGLDNFNLILKSYSASKRFYHNLWHLWRGLVALDEYHATVGYRQSPWVEYAYWYHDIFQVWNRGDNEEISAGVALAPMMLSQCRPTAQHLVLMLILGTKHQGFPAGASVEEKVHIRLIQDIDLAIFGQNEKDYDEYEVNVAKEYPINFRTFCQKRAEVLEGFLKRPMIYQTSYFQERFELKARRNLARAIEQLTK